MPPAHPSRRTAECSSDMLDILPQLLVSGLLIGGVYGLYADPDGTPFAAIARGGTGSRELYERAIALRRARA